jgi:transglutaminase-like putative cysteine protease
MDLFLVAVAIILIVAIIRIALAVITSSSVRIDVPAQSSINPEGLFFVALRVRRALQRWFSGRALKYFEFTTDFQSPSAVRIDMCCPRTPLVVKLFFKNLPEPGLTEVAAMHKTRFEAVPYRLSGRTTSDGIQLKVLLYLSEPVDGLRFSFPTDIRKAEYRAEVTAAERTPADYLLLNDGFAALDRGDKSRAKDLLTRYETYCRCNPYAHAALARTHLLEGNWTAAEQRAMRTIEYGLFDIGSDIYGFARSKRGFPAGPDTLDELRQIEQEWQVNTQIGVIVLLDSQEYYYDFGPYYLNRHHNIVLVRRAAAARFLTQIRFDYSPQEEGVLHSQLRIHRTNGNEIIEVGRDNLTVVDSVSRNPAVMTRAEKRAVWILPELQSGDIIEWTVDKVRKNRRVCDRPHPFEITSIFSSLSPTVRGRVDFVVPDLESYRFFQTRADGLSKVIESDPSGLKHVIYTGEKHQSVRNPGFIDGERWLNPRVGLTVNRCTWAEIARSIRESLLGADWEDDELPEELAAVLEEESESIKKLEAVFYWIRDRLKYGVFESAEMAIGTTNRASAIVRSGLADCKDRSYLLTQVCRHLGLEWELVTTSSEIGSFIEELPADQGDHVMLRTKLDTRWLYLDATSSACVFGSVPSWYQGMKALVLDEEGSIITLPEDQPHENLLVIREAVTEVRDGWLASSFFLHARGHVARLLEERWKAMSLQHHNRLLASCEALEPFLPKIRIERFDQLSSTSASSTFKVAGTCLRCSMTPLDDVVVGRFEWGTPDLPVRQWRTYEFGPLFHFSYPMEIDIETTFTADLANRLTSTSPFPEFTADGLQIVGQQRRENGEAAMRRRIVVDRRIFEGENLPEALRGFFSTLENALELTVMLRSS